jgi:hypothetical protein
MIPEARPSTDFLMFDFRERRFVERFSRVADAATNDCFSLDGAENLRHEA